MAKAKYLLTAAGAAAIVWGNPAAAAECADLTGMALENGRVTAAQVVAPGAFVQPAGPGAPPGVAASGPYEDLPAFCRVQATLTPTSDSDIKVEVWLPQNDWNGKFVGIGNGIWAGQLSYSQLADPLSKGYAVATTDTGHTGSGLTVDWGVGHPEKLVDFGHRAVHLMVTTAKQAIADYYGRGPKISLWNSCSTGGRQGLMEAYRYPEDFDAISAMAPANTMSNLMTQSMWAGWQPHRWPGAALSPQTLGLIHQAAVKQCDKLDGTEDGLIGLPEKCGFDPVVLQCKAGQSEGCLNAAQVAAMRNIYGGVRAPDGTQILPGWPPGSEMQLAALVMGDKPFPVASSYYELILHADDPDWDWKSLNYARGLEMAREHGAEMFDVPADGLDAYFDRGGKLLLSHGWSDGLIPASNTLAFYRGLYADLSADEMANQLRLFMAPGMDHCGGGEGPSQIDTLGIIDEWATTGKAPDRILAVRPTDAGGFPGAPPAPPREPMSRPLCPWPMYAKYDGEGETSEAENFVCAMR